MTVEYIDKIRVQPPFEKYYSPKNLFAWIWIPKNGTNTIAYALCNKLKWHKNRKLIHGTQYFGMIRDPIERWCSGTAILTRNKPLAWIGDEILAGNIGWLVERKWHDIHTAPQAWYYEDVPRLTLFEFPRFDVMWDWLEKESEGWIVPPRSWKNKRDTESEDWNIYLKLREQIYGNPDYLAELNAFYAKDWELWENRTK